jgi:branched-chain amino acid transport system substrate-binding protein
MINPGKIAYAEISDQLKSGSSGRVQATRPARVYVAWDGALEELDSKAGLLRIEAHKKLVRYAQAVLHSDREELRFIWIGEKTRWMSIHIRAERANPSGARAILEIEDIEAPFSLTVRELDVLTLTAAGFGNEGIAVRLAVSQRTVTTHVENIFEKAQIWTRAGLAGMATDRGLLRLPTPGGSDSYPLGTGIIEQLTTTLKDIPPRKCRPVVRRPVLVGMPLSLAGRGMADAVEMLNGAQLAVEQINERGGVLGRELQLLTVDYDIGAEKSIVDAYTTLINSEVDAITAGYSCVEPAVQKLVGEFRGPYLHAATMDSVVERVRNDPSNLGNIFQVCASDVNYGMGLSRFLMELEQSGQWKSRNRFLVVLQPFWPGLNVGLAEIDRRLGREGWRIEVISDLPGEDANWVSIMEKLQRLDPSVIVLASYFYEDGIAFQKAFLSNPISALVYNLYSPSVPAYREELGEQANGVLWATTTGLYSDRIGNDFVARYKQRHGREPGQSHASIAYDRVNILAGSWSRVGNTRLFEKVVTDLRSTVHRGVNGSYFFGTDGQVGLAFPDDTKDPSISQAHLVFQIQNGDQRILSPQPYVNGRFRTPRWMIE